MLFDCVVAKRVWGLISHVVGFSLGLDYESETEATHHMLFDCVVAKRVWELISHVVGFSLGSDYESIGKL
jgi:hypothetical protein